MAGKKEEVTKHLTRFKKNGTILFDKVLEIPSVERMPAIADTDEGYDNLLTALSASVSSLFDGINLRVGLSAEQMIQIAEMVIDQSSEDNLSLEDFLLFGQKFLLGNYGHFYDRMDVPTFFDAFEKYRQVRHKIFMDIKEEKHANFRVMGRGTEKRMDKGMDPQTFMDLYDAMRGDHNDEE